MNIRRLMKAGVIGGRAQYWQRVKNIFSSSLIAYYPLNELSGLTAYDVSGNGRHATYRNTGVTLGQPGIGDGGTSAYFDGTGYCNFYSAGLASAFSGAEGSLGIQIKPDAVYSDNTSRYAIQIRVDANNRIYIEKNTSNILTAAMIFGGNAHYWTLYNATDWTQIFFTWSRSANKAYVFQNSNSLFDPSPCEVWAGALASTVNCFGAGTTTPAVPWKGRVAHVIMLNQAITQEQIKRTSIGPTNIGIIGDSISNGSSTEWVHYLGVEDATNHAVSSQTIVSHMAAQVAAAANDNAKTIIIALGTNDDNAGNMATLQATYEAGIVALRASNPRATIYSMNVLPKWTDNTGATPVDKSNIRTAIAAACTAQSITCWDTFTSPWITAAQTSDGVHPTSAGHAAIASQVLARIS